MPERLVLLTMRESAAELARLRQRHRVPGCLPPHLAVVELDDKEAEELSRRPGIAVLSDPAQALPAPLGETEQLFVQAWWQRQGMQGKQRRGDGQPWDAPGFSPPDPPS